MIQQKHQVVDKNKAARLSHGNPIGAKGNQLHNFVSKTTIPQKHVMKIMQLNVPMEIPVFGHQSKSRTTKCACLRLV